ncbi:ABC transporter permease [Nonomuraea sp. NPDC000554]|uniref:ABC transporter permease n=1 Tax=Nonomuraea sp. NPDC000554 TaxID=3154259 RepID=UPI00331BFBE9
MTTRRRGGACELWAAFRASAAYPATVLVFILAVAAGLFAGSYTYAMANPTPHKIPIAVVSDAASSRQEPAFVADIQRTLHASLDQRPFATYDQAVSAVEEQRVFAVLELRGTEVRLDVASAAGASVAQLLAGAAPKAAAQAGVVVTVRDLKPLQPGDPRGLALFYISLAAVVVGFIGAIQLSVHARELEPPERIAFTAAYSVLGGFSIAAVVDWLLGAVDLPFAESWAILALTMFTSGMVFTMFNTFMGRWAMLPTWGLMVLVGNPSSGGAVSAPLLPSPFGVIGRWLPPGASVSAQHAAVYFPHHQHVLPFLVLAVWAVVSSAVFWIWRHRHPGGRAEAANPEEAGGVH